VHSDDDCQVAEEGARWDRDDFRGRLAAEHRRVAREALVLIAGISILFWGLFLYAESMGRRGVPAESPERCAVGVALLLTLLVGAVALIWRSRNPAFNCPQCQAPLNWGMEPYYAIVTGRCPKCAVPLFAGSSADHDEKPVVATPGLLCRAEINEAWRRASRSAFRAAIPRAIAGLLILLIGVAAGPWLRESLQVRLGDIWTPFVAPVALFPGVIIEFWGMIAWVAPARVGRPCPCCSRQISPGDVAVMTGYCPACGSEAVRDPFPGMERGRGAYSGGQWPLNEFRELAGRKRGRLWIGCILGTAVAAAWGALIIALVPAGVGSSDTSKSVHLGFIGAIGVAVFQCGGAWLWQKWLARGLECAHCGGELLNFYPLVVCTRRCYHCGGEAIGGGSGTVGGGEGA